MAKGLTYRKHVEKLLHDMLVSEFVSSSLVEHILPQLHNVKTNIDGLVDYLAETVSEIRQPISTVETKRTEDEVRQIDLKVRLNSVLSYFYNDSFIKGFY